MSAFHPLRTLDAPSIVAGVKDEISFGPEPLLVGVWTLLCSPPALIAAYLLFEAPTAGAATTFAWSLVFPVLPVLFACRFRATFTPTEFIYRRWGPTIRVPLSRLTALR
jgi:hypothetical protein